MRLSPLWEFRALFCLPLLLYLVDCSGIDERKHELHSQSDFLYANNPKENEPVMEFFPASGRIPKKGDFRTSVKPKMVEFYNPYCGACQSFKPKYLKLARALKKQVGDNMEVYAVSCLGHKDICNEYDANEVPMVGLFQEGSTDPQRLRKLKFHEKNPVFIVSYLFPEKVSRNTRALEESGDERENEENNEEGNDNKREEKETTEGEEGKEDSKEGNEGSEEDNENNEEGGAGDNEKNEKGTEAQEDGLENNDESNEEKEGDNEEKGEDDDIVQGNKHNENAIQDIEKGKTEEAAGPGGDVDGDGEDAETEETENGLGGDVEGSMEADNNGPGEEEGDGEVADNHEEEDDDSGEEVAKEGDGDGGDEDGEEEPDEDGENEPDEGERLEGREQLGRGEDFDQRMVDAEEANRKWFSQMGNVQESESRSKPSAEHEKPGARFKKGMPSDMDRFKEAMAQLTNKDKLSSMFRREPLGTHTQRFKAEKIDRETGATHAMKAHTPGTPEYAARQKEVQAHMNNLMRKKRLRTTPPERRFSAGVGGASRLDLPPNHKPVMPYKKGVQKPKLAHDIVGKVPIVRQMVKLSHEEELILDASLSFINALKVGLFRSSEQLPKSAKRALQSWLDFLRISLPPEWALHELIMDLDNNLDFISQKEQNLFRFLRKHELPRQQWSQSCTKNGRMPQNGFNCGFWKLLHVASVGIAEHRGGINLVDANLVSKEVRVFSPLEAADAMKGFIANFFPCTQCRNHFVAAYDDCSNRRCARLSEETEEASFADWQELSKWLWEFHNDVNVRLFRERSTKRDLSIHDDISVLYPSLESCISCFLEDGRYDEDGVFLYLEQEYWPGASDIDPASDKLLTFHNVEYAGAVSSWAILFVAVGIIYMLRPKGVFKRPKKRSE